MISHIVYIHGFLSSPLSHKAQQFGEWLRSQHPEIRYHCPTLPAYPAESWSILTRLIESQPENLGLIGSSLGGFWATLLAERYNRKAVLINPAVSPQNLLPPYLHQPLRNYHLDQSYLLTEKDLDVLKSLDVPIKHHNNYWLLAQTGDETLDYRQAVDHYNGCRQTIEEGGDHAFQGFERYFTSIYDFYNE